MRLRKYDNKYVRIYDIFGDYFDGICSYNDREYNKGEFGHDEECLQILNFLFYKSTIKKVEILEHGFIDSYGKLEELILEDGINSIIDVFESEEEEHILRLLHCIDTHLTHSPELKDAIKYLLRYNEDDKVQEEARKLLNKMR